MASAEKRERKFGVICVQRLGRPLKLLLHLLHVLTVTYNGPFNLQIYCVETIVGMN